MNRRARTLLALSLVATAIAMAPHAALAQTTQMTSSFNVTLAVPASCAVSAQAITFPYQATGDMDATGDVTVNCPDGVAYKVGLDGGQNWGGVREMREPSNSGGLGYQLFKDSGRTQPWGDNDLFPNTGATGISVGGTGTGSDQTLTIYGRLGGLVVGAVPAGTYTDTVNVIVEF